MTLEEAANGALAVLIDGNLNAPPHEVIDRAMEECGCERGDLLDAVTRAAVEWLWSKHPNYDARVNSVRHYSMSLAALAQGDIENVRHIVSEFQYDNGRVEEWKAYVAVVLLVCDVLSAMLSIPC